MNDLDAMLTRLAEAPAPAGLDGMEARVLARITVRPVAHAGLRIGATTIALALVMGIFGARVPTREARAMSPLSPLGSVSALAPSSLLDGAP
ncbi:hypothetical protein [Novosphingobium rosa]|jgi:hypothetical protein|uniref:hypothetical protein n=1 Tax=Novosphingobium rosa TaxID=76978 RepID=UPI00082DF886|nr:hypothetical protein [Novosphingobium rosa]